MINHPNRGGKKQPERAVVVTTQHRGVFFGYATDIDGEAINLTRARNCLRWGEATKGFMGLANTGPLGNGTRVGPAADIQLRDITSVTLCSDEAVKVWEAAPWK